MPLGSVFHVKHVRHPLPDEEPPGPARNWAPSDGPAPTAGQAQQVCRHRDRCRPPCHPAAPWTSARQVREERALQLPTEQRASAIPPSQGEQRTSVWRNWATVASPANSSSGRTDGKWRQPWRIDGASRFPGAVWKSGGKPRQRPRGRPAAATLRSIRSSSTPPCPLAGCTDSTGPRPWRSTALGIRGRRG
jgi:hypothetical protein